MKILLVTDVSMASIIGGAERVLYEQGTRLAKRGHQVSVLTRRLPSHNAWRAMIKGVYEFRYLVNTTNPAAYIRSTVTNGRRLFEELSENSPFDSICFHQPFSALAVCRSRLARTVRKIYTCHSLSFEEYISRNQNTGGILKHAAFLANVFGRKWMERYVLTNSDRIIVLSRYTQKKLRNAYKIAPEKIHVIPGGVDLARFLPASDKIALRDAQGIPKNRVVIFTVRNLVARMGLENLIKALSILRCSVPEIYLVIGGTGPLADKLESMARELGLSSVIHFAGFIPEDKLPDYYRMADLFVLPTKELEGFGLVTLEAMASGVPVLGTPVGGTKEILARFEPNLLFENTSAEAMAALLRKTCRKIHGDPAGWRNFSRKAREFVETHYGWNANVDALEALMDPEAN